VFEVDKREIRVNRLRWGRVTDNPVGRTRGFPNVPFLRDMAHARRGGIYAASGPGLELQPGWSSYGGE